MRTHKNHRFGDLRACLTSLQEANVGFLFGSSKNMLVSLLAIDNQKGVHQFEKPRFVLEANKMLCGRCGMWNSMGPAAQRTGATPDHLGHNVVCGCIRFPLQANAADWGGCAEVRKRHALEWSPCVWKLKLLAFRLAKIAPEASSRFDLTFAQFLFPESRS